MSAIEALVALRESLQALTRAVKAGEGDRVNRQAILTDAKKIGTSWFFEVRPAIEGGAVPKDVLDRYGKGFERLVKISSPNNRKASYLATLDGLTKKFKTELLLPLQTAPPPANEATVFDELFVRLGDVDADDAYLKEAVDCARAGFIRAAAVMGWCAAIARIHKAIEKIGFAKFNVASAGMASQTQGRFKKFHRPQSVTSISDLQLVFDTDVLWILEGMQVIDANQHARLRSCFELRNHSAHPGGASHRLQPAVVLLRHYWDRPEEPEIRISMKGPQTRLVDYPLADVKGSRAGLLLLCSCGQPSNPSALMRVLVHP